MKIDLYLYTRVFVLTCNIIILSQSFNPIQIALQFISDYDFLEDF